eukprot:TRINITY_DN1550_c0_g3_i1.p2 TRINITY_DN1550_c0_g3~~TRINITY_DN1550_c0_g3_i1.p2  ORF type:complete len:224 (-),score=44.90 TRINITY_DN1550_c0_g3_i1:62-733(-)
MEQAGLVHRDIKPENIMVTGDMKLKLIDFGFAAKLKDNGTVTGCCGTTAYMAPEVLLRKNYNGAVDVFSLGATAFVMTNCAHPFIKATSTDPYYKNIAKGDFEAFSKVANNCRDKADPLSLEMRELLFKMMAHDPKVRPTLTEIEEHPWMKGPMATLDEVKTLLLSQSQQGEDTTFGCSSLNKDEDIIRKKVCNNTTALLWTCLLYTSPSPRDGLLSRMPSSA